MPGMPGGSGGPGKPGPPGGKKIELIKRFDNSILNKESWYSYRLSIKISFCIGPGKPGDPGKNGRPVCF